jgi:hypothetical protein
VEEGNGPAAGRKALVRYIHLSLSNPLQPLLPASMPHCRPDRSHFTGQIPAMPHRFPHRFQGSLSQAGGTSKIFRWGGHFPSMSATRSGCTILKGDPCFLYPGGEIRYPLAPTHPWPPFTPTKSARMRVYGPGVDVAIGSCGCWPLPYQYTATGFISRLGLKPLSSEIMIGDRTTPQLISLADA